MRTVALAAFSLLLCGALVSAHVVSMSTGEATLSGARLDYRVRMPLYETAHMANPESELFANIQFSGRGGAAKLLRHACHEEGGNLVCDGLYLFDREVDQFDVRCTFPSVTVSNHVHLLRAIHGQRTDQAAFDASFTSAAIRFRPPTPLETATRDASAGFWRAIAGLAQLLFLSALVLAGRNWRELATLTGMFIAGEAASVFFGLSSRLPVSPRFVEAAAALTIAYLAVDILLLPGAGGRWLVVFILGLLHGIYFDLLLLAADYQRAPYVLGVAAAEIAVVLSLGFVAQFARRSPRTRLLERALASVLLVAGACWFALRLAG